jgi:hypothetical protein
LKSLALHYKNNGFKPKWAQIHAAHAEEFGTFDADHMGSKARKMGMNKDFKQ